MEWAVMQTGNYLAGSSSGLVLLKNADGLWTLDSTVGE